jgi:hypothetical protein
MDIGTAVKFAFEDRDWWKKCLMVGLYTFIPILGVIAAMGWQRRIYDRVRAGQPTPLPSIELGSDLKYGISPFLAVMNITFVVLGMWIVLAVFGAIAGAIDDSLVGIVMGLGGMGLGLVALVLSLLMPDFLRRGFADDEKFPLLRPGPTLRAITGDPGSYIMMYLGLMVGNFLGGIGGVLCGVGAIVTSPWGLAIGAHVIAQRQDRLEGR